MKPPVMTSEAREIRRRIEAGESRESIARGMGRRVITVTRYMQPDLAPGQTFAQATVANYMRGRAERLDRLFAACNRALEARP